MISKYCWENITVINLILYNNLLLLLLKQPLTVLKELFIRVVDCSIRVADRVSRSVFSGNSGDHGLPATYCL